MRFPAVYCERGHTRPGSLLCPRQAAVVELSARGSLKKNAFGKTISKKGREGESRVTIVDGDHSTTEILRAQRLRGAGAVLGDPSEGLGQRVSSEPSSGPRASILWPGLPTAAQGSQAHGLLALK